MSADASVSAESGESLVKHQVYVLTQKEWDTLQSALNCALPIGVSDWFDVMMLFKTKTTIEITEKKL